MKIERKKITIDKGSKRLPKAGEREPNFPSLLTAHPEGKSPLLNMPETGDAEQNATDELGEVAQQIIAAKKEKRDEFRVLTDPNFYLVVCFQSAAQCDEFAEKAGWKRSGAFVNGLKVAEQIGVDIEPINMPKKINRPMPVALRGHKVIT